MRLRSLNVRVFAASAALVAVALALTLYQRKEQRDVSEKTTITTFTAA